MPPLKVTVAVPSPLEIWPALRVPPLRFTVPVRPDSVARVTLVAETEPLPLTVSEPLPEDNPEDDPESAPTVRVPELVQLPPETVTLPIPWLIPITPLLLETNPPLIASVAVLRLVEPMVRSPELVQFPPETVAVPKRSIMLFLLKTDPFPLMRSVPLKAPELSNTVKSAPRVPKLPPDTSTVPLEE